MQMQGWPSAARSSLTTYAYTASERLASITSKNLIATTSDAVTETYASTGDLLTIANSLSHTITFSDYNARGQPGKRTGINGEVTDYVYDTRGRVTTVTTRRNNIAASTVWSYAVNGLLASMTSPDGVVETYTYSNPFLNRLSPR
jgi:YD repeat-containing protein